ncbi:hypothetical protein U5640_22815 [Streptomyces sp. SS7]|uniref:hypothetical protein n=1 Tax=Streptomyces sp. SS7 TaxID=3108485 RepID=UPI0030EBDE3F
MFKPPVPIPPGLMPTGIASWLSADAGGWSRSRPGGWARPLWSVLGLLVGVGVAAAVEPEPVCDATALCGPDWHDMIRVGLVLGLLYWYPLLPEIALTAVPVLAVLVVWQADPVSDPAVAQAAHLGVLAALGFGWAAALARLAARRRQRRLAARASVAAHRPPDGAGRGRRGALRIVVGVLLCLVAAGSTAVGLVGVVEDERHAARAVRTPAEVTGREAATVRVRTGDGRHLVLTVPRPGGYRTGSPLTVLEDGAWRRLASRPYDPFVPEMVATALGLPGLVLLATGAIMHRRTARLRRPVPALRVLLRFDHRGRSWFYAVDDLNGHAPLFSCYLDPVRSLEPRARTDGRHTTDRAALDQHMAATGSGLRQAVVFGEPYERGELLVVTTIGDGTPAMLRTVEPVRSAAVGEGPGTDDPDVTGSAGIGHFARVTGHPLHWGPDTRARVLGGAMAMCVVLGAKTVSGRLIPHGPDENIVALLALLTLVHPAATLLNWRVTMDAAGLSLTGAWTARHVPWEEVRSAVRGRDSGVSVRLADGSSWHLPGMARPVGGARSGSPPAHVRMAEEINALCAHPELRPTEESGPRDHALPAGPLLLVATGLAMIASFLG